MRLLHLHPPATTAAVAVLLALLLAACAGTPEAATSDPAPTTDPADTATTDPAESMPDVDSPIPLPGSSVAVARDDLLAAVIAVARDAGVAGLSDVDGYVVDAVACDGGSHVEITRFHSVDDPVGVFHALASALPADALRTDVEASAILPAGEVSVAALPYAGQVLVVGLSPCVEG